MQQQLTGAMQQLAKAFNVGQRRPMMLEGNEECYLLGLPLEVLMLIWEYLPASHQYILATTCRQLWLGLPVVPTALLETPRCHLNYLSAVLNDEPEQWVCEACARLHPVSHHDFPDNNRKESHVTCPLSRVQWNEKVYSNHDSQHYRVDPRLIPLEHRHVQLALRFARTKDAKHKSYLRNLLRPYRVFNFDTNALHPKAKSTTTDELSVRYTARPKLARNAAGELRFLLRSTWYYSSKNFERPASLDAMGDLRFCPHLHFIGEGHSSGGMREKMRAALKGQPDKDALEGSCSVCPTDYSICVTENFAKLRVWQDLGAEGSPTDLAWRVQALCLDHDGDFNKDKRGELRLPHVSGSVQRWYETGKYPEIEEEEDDGQQQCKGKKPVVVEGMLAECKEAGFSVAAARRFLAAEELA